MATSKMTVICCKITMYLKAAFIVGPQISNSVSVNKDTNASEADQEKSFSVNFSQEDFENYFIQQPEV